MVKNKILIFVKKKKKKKFKKARQNIGALKVFASAGCLTRPFENLSQLLVTVANDLRGYATSVAPIGWSA